MSAILSALANGGIAGAAVTLAVWLVLSMVPRRALNAATRYAVWWITLLVVVTLPLFYLPHRAEPAAASLMPVAMTNGQTETLTVTQPAAVVVGEPVVSRWPQFPLEVSAGLWPGRFFAAWGLATALMLLRLALSYLFLEKRKRRARPVEGLQAWPVRALISPDIASPMAAGLFRPAILLPERLLAELDSEEIEQIRLHETAHLLRRDDVALLIQRVIEALFSLHPMVRWITRRIDLEREIACDDFVVEKTGQARPYASCLTRVVEIAGGVRSSRFGAAVASAATEERSHLARRIEMLLDKTRHRGTRLLKVRFLLMGVALMALAVVAVRTPGLIAFAADSAYDQEPAVPEPPVPPAPPAAPEPLAPAAPPVPAAPAAPPAPPAPQAEPHSSPSITWRTKDGLHSREMRVRGEVHFNDTETDVQSISADGQFSYEEAYGFASRRYEVTSDSSGHLTRRYLVDGHEKAFDADAKAWLRAILPDLLRESGIDAPERVRRILKQGGAPAVIAEIGKIHSDGTKKLYIGELLLSGKLSSDQYQSLLRIVRGMGSDGEKAAVLVFLAPNVLKDNLRDYAFEALKTIHSDGEKHRVLTQFISHDSSRGTLALAARATGDINSDGEKAAVLVDLAGYWKDDDLVRHAYFETARTVHSDGEKARVLTSLVGRGGLSDRTLIEAVHCASGIHSDGEKARVLVAIAKHSNEKSEVRGEIQTAAATIHSDGEYRRVMASINLPGSIANRPQAR